MLLVKLRALIASAIKDIAIFFLTRLFFMLPELQLINGFGGAVLK
jgi:hypothetical protein